MTVVKNSVELTGAISKMTPSITIDDPYLSKAIVNIKVIPLSTLIVIIGLTALSFIFSGPAIIAITGGLFFGARAVKDIIDLISTLGKKNVMRLYTKYAIISNKKQCLLELKKEKKK